MTPREQLTIAERSRYLSGLTDAFEIVFPTTKEH